MAESFSYEQLIASGEGKLFNPDSGRLPLPPMLMFDRITHISEDGGAHGLGRIEAELEGFARLYPAHADREEAEVYGAAQRLTNAELDRLGARMRQRRGAKD